MSATRSFRLVLAAAAFLCALPAGAAAPREKILYAFGSPPDGASPQGAVALDAQGDVWGTTFAGGTDGFGTVFRISKKGAETLVHDFASYRDGARPVAGLTPDGHGNFFGTTTYGGGAGTVYRVNSAGKVKILYRFYNVPDGAVPWGGVAIDAAGTLYGTTANGGAHGFGSIYRLTPDGHETVLHSFTFGPDGAYPYCTPVLDAQGRLFGTASSAATGPGVVWRLDTATGALDVLHAFAGGSGDGASPLGNLALDAAGNVYGTTQVGGQFGEGVVFQVTPAGQETVLHAFAGSDGANPLGGVTIDAAGTLYGTTYDLGARNGGNVFRLSPATGAFRILYSFSGGEDGGYPQAAPVVDAQGDIYGVTTLGGGLWSGGAVYRISR